MQDHRMFTCRCRECERFSTCDHHRFEDQQSILHQLSVRVRSELEVKTETSIAGVLSRLDLVETRRGDASAQPFLDLYGVIRFRKAAKFRTKRRGCLPVGL